MSIAKITSILNFRRISTEPIFGRFREVSIDPVLHSYVEDSKVSERWESSPVYKRMYKIYFRRRAVTCESLKAFQRTAWYNDELSVWVVQQQKTLLADCWHWESETRNGVSIKVMEFDSIASYRAYVEVYGCVPECMNVDGEILMITFRVKGDELGLKNR